MHGETSKADWCVLDGKAIHAALLSGSSSEASCGQSVASLDSATVNNEAVRDGGPLPFNTPLASFSTRGQGDPDRSKSLED
jgi:hypothetical protein